MRRSSRPYDPRNAALGCALVAVAIAGVLFAGAILANPDFDLSAKLLELGLLVVVAAIVLGGLAAAYERGRRRP